MGIITSGVALNAIVIGLNLGMPVRLVAFENGRRIDKPIEATVKHRPASSEDLVGFLGDKILLPSPIDTLISPGDLVIAIGVCELAYYGSHQRRRRRRRRAHARMLASAGHERP